jgi:hypothetical protein
LVFRVSRAPTTGRPAAFSDAIQRIFTPSI